VNVDLIYGSPWESPDDWSHTLDGVVAADPDHVSAYALTVEEGTPLHTLVATGRVNDVDPDDQADRFAVASDVLAVAGYERYEISNWAKPARASRHNTLYWSAGDYVGFGAGAHSHVTGHRWWTTRLPRDYIDAVAEHRSTKGGEEVLDADQRAGEALMLGLRLASGMTLDGFVQRFGQGSFDSRSTEIAKLESEGLIEWTEDRLCLSAAGTLLANDALCRLL
jgi:oxygen-independent coproporphyrinogen-3 oxidase